MRTKSKSEFAEWCSLQGLRDSGREWPIYLGSDSYSFLLKLPQSPYRAVALARMCFPFADSVEFQGAMIWFREWGIGTDVDEETGMQATLRMRGALGETRPLIDIPGHVFSPDEFADARAFWTVPIVFGWDAILFPRKSDYFVFNSHDEVICFVSRTKEAHSLLHEEFEDWKPEEDGWYFR
jgi:hypothetical protein